MKIRPLHDRVIVKRLEEERTSAGGIIIPDSATEKPIQGKIVRVVPEDQMVAALVDEAERLVAEGVEARLAAADAGAEAEAAADRAALLDAKGMDANLAAVRIEAIRERLGED